MTCVEAERCPLLFIELAAAARPRCMTARYRCGCGVIVASIDRVVQARGLTPGDHCGTGPGNVADAARAVRIPAATLGAHSRGNPQRVTVTSVRPDEQRRALGFGVRGVLAGLALGLVAVPFGLLLFFVEDKWAPLLRVDDGARDGLHAFALQHRWFVVAMETLSTIGPWWMYLPVFVGVAGWLLWRRYIRLAVFVAVTVGVSPGLNDLVKWAVHRARPVLDNPVAHENGASFPRGHAQAAVVG